MIPVYCILTDLSSRFSDCYSLKTGIIIHSAETPISQLNTTANRLERMYMI